jgi:hypothetical protein
VRGDANPSLSDRSRWRSTPPRACLPDSSHRALAAGSLAARRINPADDPATGRGGRPRRWEPLWPPGESRPTGHSPASRTRPIWSGWLGWRRTSPRQGLVTFLSAGGDTPSPELPRTRSFLVTGEGHKIRFSAPRAGTALLARPPEEHPWRWLRTAAAIIIGVATIVAVFISLMEHKAGVLIPRPPSRIQYRSLQEDR